MKNMVKLLPFNLLITAIGCSSHMKHAKTITMRIDGDCPMCEERIEKVGFVKNVAEVDWVVETHMATVKFDSTRTNVDEIMQRLAHAGYDNELFLAPKEAYDKLPGCCQYDRSMAMKPASEEKPMDHSAHNGHGNMDHGTPAADRPAQKEMHQFSAVLDAYFELKNALVESDEAAAKKWGSQFSDAVNGVPMESLGADLHTQWMAIMPKLISPAQVISKTETLDGQRKAFVALTEPMLELAKLTPNSGPIYLDHCPMYEGGADWLSQEKAIKNPFYGSMMLSCGSVKETIKK